MKSSFLHEGFLAYFMHSIILAQLLIVSCLSSEIKTHYEQFYSNSSQTVIPVQEWMWINVGLFFIGGTVSTLFVLYWKFTNCYVNGIPTVLLWLSLLGWIIGGLLLGNDTTETEYRVYTGLFISYGGGFFLWGSTVRTFVNKKFVVSPLSILFTYPFLLAFLILIYFYDVFQAPNGIRFVYKIPSLIMFPLLIYFFIGFENTFKEPPVEPQEEPPVEPHEEKQEEETQEEKQEETTQLQQVVLTKSSKDFFDNFKFQSGSLSNGPPPGLSRNRFNTISEKEPLLSKENNNNTPRRHLFLKPKKLLELLPVIKKNTLHFQAQIDSSVKSQHYVKKGFFKNENQTKFSWWKTCCHFLSVFLFQLIWLFPTSIHIGANPSQVWLGGMALGGWIGCVFLVGLYFEVEKSRLDKKLDDKNSDNEELNKDKLSCYSIPYLVVILASVAFLLYFALHSRFPTIHPSFLLLVGISSGILYVWQLYVTLSLYFQTNNNIFLLSHVLVSIPGPFIASTVVSHSEERNVMSIVVSGLLITCLVGEWISLCIK